MSTATEVEFWVPGQPRTQGSVRAMIGRHTGKPFIQYQGSEDLMKWREAIAITAGRAWCRYARQLVKQQYGQKLSRDYDVAPTRHPVALTLVWHFPRPASHFGSGRNEGKLKPGKPRYPVPKKRWDIDKLERAVLDALTGVVYDDDCQVVHVLKWKAYADPGRGPGVEVTIKELEP